MRFGDTRIEEYCWEDWKKDTKKSYPVRYFVQETLATWVRVHAVMPIEQAHYWIRSHTYKRYHILNIRSDANDYKWGYYDPCDKVLYASFKILSDFVEQEMSSVCYYVSAENNAGEEWDDREARSKIMSLYNWWTTERLQRINDNDSYFFPPVTLSPEDAKSWKSEDDIMLERLLSIRNKLWS